MDHIRTTERGGIEFSKVIGIGMLVLTGLSFLLALASLLFSDKAAVLKAVDDNLHAAVLNERQISDNKYFPTSEGKELKTQVAVTASTIRQVKEKQAEQESKAEKRDEKLDLIYTNQIKNTQVLEQLVKQLDKLYGTGVRP
jgi:microsomal dipeptidase-like Zn-dependent dipeptidase